jgi:isochorismate hydrolase
MVYAAVSVLSCDGVTFAQSTPLLPCRSAFTKNFNVIMLSDGNAGFDRSLHEAPLKAFETGFGKVLSCDEIVSMLEQHRQ